MQETQEQVLKEYADLCVRIKADEARKKMLQVALEEQFGQKEETVKMPYGTFKMVARTTYEYSDQLKEAEEDLKIAKQDEQEQNIAVPNTVYGLRFNAPKAEKK